MASPITDSVRVNFFTVYDLNLMDDVRVKKMEKFLKERGWMQWTPFFWAKYQETIIHLQIDPNYPGMLLEDAYEYELNGGKDDSNKQTT